MFVYMSIYICVYVYMCVCVMCVYCVYNLHLHCVYTYRSCRIGRRGVVVVPVKPNQALVALLHFILSTSTSAKAWPSLCHMDEMMHTTMQTLTTTMGVLIRMAGKGSKPKGRKKGVAF